MSVVYPQVDPEVWAKQYNLPIGGRVCQKCGVMRVPTIPFATKDWRGIKSVVHEPCGPNYILKVLQFADPDERAEWQETVKQLYSHLGGDK